MNIAELICHTCGAVSYSRLPVHRTDTMPACTCGGRRQVVRVRSERRKVEEPVAEDRRKGPRLVD